MIRLIVWLALIILTFANLISYKSIYETNRFSNLVDQDQNILDQIYPFDLALNKAELEGYLYFISDQKIHLDNYSVLKSKIHNQINYFNRLFINDKEKYDQLIILDKLTEKKLSLIDSLLIKDKKAEHRDIITNKSNELTIQLNIALANIKNSVKKSLQYNVNKEHQKRMATFLETSIGDFLGLILILSAFYFLYKENKTRIQTEKELRESEEKLRSSFDYATIGMAMVDLDYKCLKVNQALCKIVGYQEKELLDINFKDIIHPDDINSDHQLITKILSGEITSYQIEKKLFDKNEDIILALLSVSLVHDLSGKPLYFIYQIQDITQRKKMN